MKLKFALDKGRNMADSSDIKTNGDDTPIGFGANEL